MKVSMDAALEHNAVNIQEPVNNHSARTPDGSIISICLAFPYYLKLFDGVENIKYRLKLRNCNRLVLVYSSVYDCNSTLFKV